MQREQRRDQRAPPGRAGQLAQRQKQQRRVEGVKRGVDEMKPARMDAKQLAIEHV